MSIDWKLMINLRERQRTTASDKVAREREAVAQSEAQVRAAQARLAQEQDSKAALWSDTAAAFYGGVCNIERLQQASAWSRTLDGKVAQAAQSVHQAQVVAQQKNAVLEARRQELRAAMAELEKAKEMQTRLLANRRRTAEAHADEVVDEWAANQWSIQPQERV
jgi:hypothetical protein